MKVPDSGMPEETFWESLFDVPLALDRLKINRTVGHVAELGCGYGTFTLPVAQRVAGTVFTFDIEPIMIARTRGRVHAARLDIITSPWWHWPSASCAASRSALKNTSGVSLPLIRQMLQVSLIHMAGRCPWCQTRFDDTS